MLFWLATCHLTSGALNGGQETGYGTELAPYHEEEMQLRQTRSSPSLVGHKPNKLSEQSNQECICMPWYFFLSVGILILGGIYCSENRSKGCYRFWKLELFLHYRLFHLPYKKKRRIRGTVINFFPSHCMSFLELSCYPVISIGHTYSTLSELSGVQSNCTCKVAWKEYCRVSRNLPCLNINYLYRKLFFRDFLNHS